MTRLSQIVAVEKGEKSHLNDAITKAYHRFQGSEAPFSGIMRSYRPKDDDGDQLPPERTNVQLAAQDVLEDVERAFRRLIDLTATKDATNARATADVVVHDVVVAHDVNVMTLIWLEKQLTDLRSVVQKTPRLDPSKSWSLDPNTGRYRTDPVETTRTKKVLRNHVKAPATDKHPAQVETYPEDVIIGYWSTTHLSGALPGRDVDAMLDRIDALLAAVRQAREAANTQEVVDVRIGHELLSFVFEP